MNYGNKAKSSSVKGVNTFYVATPQTAKKVKAKSKNKKA